MRKKINYLFYIIALSLSLGCGNEEANYKTIKPTLTKDANSLTGFYIKTTKLTPTKDTNSPTGFYIPNNLDDCFQELERMLPPDTVQEFKQGEEKSVNRYHLNLGLWIRNNWGIWRGSRLADYFNQYDIRNPDDMSSTILHSYWRHLNDRPRKLEEQVQLYKEYWKMITRLTEPVNTE